MRSKKYKNRQMILNSTNVKKLEQKKKNFATPRHLKESTHMSDKEWNKIMTIIT